MNKMSGWIVRHKKLILVLAVLLLIPSAMGMAATRVNFDMLTYLPESLETVEGQNIMVEDFGMGAFAMVMVENMELKDVASLKEDLLQIDHVKDVLWYDSLVDLSVPPEMMPEELRDMFFQDDATLMIVLIDDSTSSDASLEAMEQIRKTASKDWFISIR
jgi:predicted RND superfamily exporter protein